MKLVLGLGNPGTRYAGTRHNAGWMVIDELARRRDVRLTHRTLQAEWVRLGQGENALILAKPRTYMNLSGRAAVALLRYFKRGSEELLVVMDDMNLPLGALRFRAGGSAGGHNGLKSIIEETGNQAFPRLRLGIGTPPPPVPAEVFVLQRFTAEEVPVVRHAVERAADGIEIWLAEGMHAAMNRTNG